MMRHVQCLDTLLFALKHAEGMSPDFVTFSRNTRNYLIIRCDYFYSGDTLRIE